MLVANPHLLALSDDDRHLLESWLLILPQCLFHRLKLFSQARVLAP
jgi:hypothetical protein